jgi:hypothetical protein
VPERPPKEDMLPADVVLARRSGKPFVLEAGEEILFEARMGHAATIILTGIGLATMVIALPALAIGAALIAGRWSMRTVITSHRIVGTMHIPGLGTRVTSQLPHKYVIRVGGDLLSTGSAILQIGSRLFGQGPVGVLYAVPLSDGRYWVAKHTLGSLGMRDYKKVREIAGQRAAGAVQPRLSDLLLNSNVGRSGRYVVPS